MSREPRRLDGGREGGAAANLSGSTSPRILTYHEIEPEKSNYLYAVTAQQLDAHLGLVAEQRARDSSAVQVTFDDGHISNFEIARGLLQRYQLKGTFFVTAGRVGSHTGTMSWSQLRALAEAGHAVQSHGWSHTFLIQCKPAQLHEELTRSKKELENRTGKRVDSISMPGGRWNVRVLRGAAEAGYRFVYTSDFLSNVVVKEGVQVAGRLMIRNDMRIADLRRWLSSEKGLPGMMGAKSRVKRLVRRVTGDNLYHRLWCWLAVSETPTGEGKSQHV